MSNLNRIPIIGIALIVLLGLGAEVHAQTATDLDCNKCVERSEILEQAISSSKIKGGAVIRSKIRDNSVNESKLSANLQDRLNEIEARTPIAFGFVDLDANILSGTGNFSVIFDQFVQRYEITIDSENYFFTDYTTVVTPTADGIVARTGSIGGRLVVVLKDLNGDPVMSNFQFVTHKY